MTHTIDTTLHIAYLVGDPASFVHEIDFMALPPDVQAYIVPDADLLKVVAGEATRDGKIYFDGRRHWLQWNWSGDVVPICTLDMQRDQLGRVMQGRVVERIPESLISPKNDSPDGKYGFGVRSARELWMPPRAVWQDKNLSRAADDTQARVLKLYEARDRKVTTNVLLYRIDQASGGVEVEIERYFHTRWYLTKTAFQDYRRWENHPDSRFESLVLDDFNRNPSIDDYEDDYDAAYFQSEPDQDLLALCEPVSHGRVYVSEWRIYPDHYSAYLYERDNQIIMGHLINEEGLAHIEATLRDRKGWRDRGDGRFENNAWADRRSGYIEDHEDEGIDY